MESAKRAKKKKRETEGGDGRKERGERREERGREKSEGGEEEEEGRERGRLLYEYPK